MIGDFRHVELMWVNPGGFLCLRFEADIDRERFIQDCVPKRIHFERMEECREVNNVGPPYELGFKSCGITELGQKEETKGV